MRRRRRGLRRVPPCARCMTLRCRRGPAASVSSGPFVSSRGTVEFPPLLDSECEWLVANDVVSADVVRRNRQVAEAALRPLTPVFIHGDLQIVHVFVDGDEVSGVVDWSEGGSGRCDV